VETASGRGPRIDIRPWLAVLLLGSGCATLTPRFSQAVTTSFATQPMRKLETARVELYYPEAQRAEAFRLVQRLDQCVELLRRKRVSNTDRPKVVAYLTTANFDNAYVQPQIGGLPPQMVLAHHFTTEFFNLLELGIDEVDDISCHEAVHYVQFQEVDELWYYLNLAFGDLLDPNIFLESYFLEGLATYYEGRLGRDTGRPHSPIWRGLFESGVALRQGEIHSGDLSSAQRELLPFGGNYVVGMHFIEWLAQRYGAEKLWQLIDVQGRSWIGVLGVSFRFMWVYGKGPGELVDEWRDSLRHSGPWRTRPAGQKTLDPDLGYFARLASAPDGTMVTVTVGLDAPPRLRIYGPDGKKRREDSLTQWLPGRATIATSSLSVSGLSLPDDARHVYFVLADVAINGDTAPKLVEIDVQSGRLLRTWETPDSIGGGVSPDGKSYVFVRSHGDTADLWMLDLASGTQTQLTRNRGRITLGAPAIAADGRVVFARNANESFDLWVRLPDGTERPLTTDGQFNYSPHWWGPDSVLAIHEVDGRTQAVRIDVSTGQITVVSDAPFVVLDPVPLPGGRLAFVNREGWGWTLDAISTAVASPAPVSTSTATAAAPGSSAPPVIASETSGGSTAGGQGTPPESALASTAADAGDASPAAIAAAASAPGGTSDGGVGSAPSAGIAPPASPPAVVEPDVPILRDDPYHALDQFFLPTLRGPFITFDSRQRYGGSQTTIYAGVSLQGSDRLGLHQYAINVGYETSDPGPTFSVAYGNYQLAPFFIAAEVARSAEPSVRDVSDNSFVPSVVDMSGVLSVSRTFWTTPLTLNFLGVHRKEGFETGPQNSDLLGPGISSAWSATESTPYAGTRLGIALTGSAQLFAKAFGSTYTFGDLRATFAGYTPLPFWDRHTLQLTLRGRAMVGAPARLLRVGGQTMGILQVQSQDDKSQAGTGLTVFPDITFREPLRGYEDATVRANQVVIAGARYRAPFILDWGWSSFLWILPSFFLREIDAELFAEWAHTWTSASSVGPASTGNHRTVGGAIFVRTLWGGAVPLSFYFQAAVRPDDGLTPLYLFGITLE